MKKGILAGALSALMLLTSLPPVMAADEQITAVDGTITGTYPTNAAAGTQVMVYILPQIIESSADVTAAKITAATSPAALKVLGVEYADVLTTDAGGAITLNCHMKDTLTTGICRVIVHHLGAQAAYSIGTFEHVGRQDKQELVDRFNNETDYAKIIADDMYGDSEAVPPLAAKEILRKSSADVDYYSSLSDTADFCAVLKAAKPTEGFDLLSLVSAFNATGAWIRLRTEADTLAVLKAYNGIYWNLPLDGADFTNLSAAGATAEETQTKAKEKTTLLSNIKAAKYVAADALEEGFGKELAMAMFRIAETREELERLIAADGSYADLFAGIRTILAGKTLSDYELLEVYNKVLAGNQNCKDIAAAESLFKQSMPTKSTGGSGSSGSSSGGSRPVSGSGGIRGDIGGTGRVTPKNDLPFTDVADNHWAYSYVKELYKNGVINGISETEFAPSAAVERQAFVKILVGALGLEPSLSDSVFSDLSVGCYWEPYIMSAYERGYISGITEEEFGMKRLISRQDAAVILARVLKQHGFAAQGEMNFADAADVADYAKEAVAYVGALGIFGGDDEGNFRPTGSLSRSEACAILCRLAKQIKEGA